MIDPSVGRGVRRLGSGFMASRYTKALADEHGFEGWSGAYFAGRTGVLGDAAPEVVAAAVAFFAVDVVRWAVRDAHEHADVRAYARRWLAAGHDWGRARLAGLEGLDRLAGLTLAVVREADVAGAPLFAAWRLEPLPADPEAQVVHATFLLREHRGAMHAAAVLAAGLTPLQAVLAAPGGEANAESTGWTPPFEDPAPYVQARAAAEQATEQAAARPYEVLDDREQAELADRLEMAVAHAFPRATLDGR